jgi:hypothetical protein
MLMIEKVFEITFIKDVTILDMMPQRPTTPQIMKVIPPPVVAPSTSLDMVPPSSSQPSLGRPGLF